MIKIKKWLYRLLKNEYMINDVLTFIILVVIYIGINKEIDFEDFVDFTILFTLLIAFIVRTLFSKAIHWILNRCEDDIKLTNDYEKIIKKYKDASWLYLEEYDLKLPIVIDGVLYNKKIIINDSTKQYCLPDFAMNHYDELISSHAHSFVYNQLNIRVDSWKTKDDVFEINTSRTTYFDTLVTNRAIDYELSNGTSIREIYQYGPFLPKLEHSKLSNHLGFTGFIRSSDGYIPLVYRQDNLSVGKRKYSCSVSASLKTKYALTNNSLTVESLLKAVLEEIHDELHISKEYLEEFSLENHHLIYALRDFIEGGKPHFVFYVQSSLSKNNIIKGFIKDNDDKSMLTDGKKLYWLKESDLDQLSFTKDSLIYNKDQLQMCASHLASVYLLKEYLKEID